MVSILRGRLPSAFPSRGIKHESRTNKCAILSKDMCKHKDICGDSQAESSANIRSLNTWPDKMSPVQAKRKATSSSSIQRRGLLLCRQWRNGGWKMTKPLEVLRGFNLTRQPIVNTYAHYDVLLRCTVCMKFADIYRGIN